MGKLIVGGDSYIWGNELTDSNNSHYSQLTWPALLAQYLKLDYECVAQYGAANNAISRHVLNCCEKFKNINSIFVIVQWTFDNRFEFRMRYDTMQADSPWYSITDWTIKEDVSVIKESFQTHSQEIYDYYARYIKNAQDLGIADFAKNFYQHVGNSEYYEIYCSLKEIVFLQNYLKINNIPFLFTSSNSTLFNPDAYALKNSDETINALMNQIDWESWFKFPGKNYPAGFYRWAQENNYPIGTTHPLEEAHQDAFNLIKEKFTCV